MSTQQAEQTATAADTPPAAPKVRGLEGIKPQDWSETWIFDQRGGSPRRVDTDAQPYDMYGHLKRTGYRFAHIVWPGGDDPDYVVFDFRRTAEQSYVINAASGEVVSTDRQLTKPWKVIQHWWYRAFGPGSSPVFTAVESHRPLRGLPTLPNDEITVWIRGPRKFIFDFSVPGDVELAAALMAEDDDAPLFRRLRLFLDPRRKVVSVPINDNMQQIFSLGLLVHRWYLVSDGHAAPTQWRLRWSKQCPGRALFGSGDVDAADNDEESAA